MNDIKIMGRITADVELKTVGSGIECAEFTVAVDRYMGKDKEKKTDFFRCVAWRGTAAMISKYFKKGDGILISGAMQNDPYEKDGKTIASWKLAVDNVYFPIGKKSSSSEPEYTEPTFDTANEQGLPF